MEYTDEFFVWRDSLHAEEQVDVKAVEDVLEEKGSWLRRSRVGPIVTSRQANMKELIIQHAGRPYRVLFAFDPRRAAILLIGGDKTGNEQWYEEFVPIAHRLYNQHIVALKKEGKI